MVNVILLKKYKKPEIEIVLMENDIITESNIGGAGVGSGGEDPWEGAAAHINKMNPLDRPLGIFKRN